MENNVERRKTKFTPLDFLIILIIAAFLVIGVILILAANQVLGYINNASVITCYVFGVISLLLFILIVVKIMFIVKKENIFRKNAIDVDKYLENIDAGTQFSEDELNTLNELKQTVEPMDVESRNIFYAYMINFERKSFKRPDLEIHSHKLNLLILLMIVEVKKYYQYFDVYLAIDFMKSMNSKFLLRGEYKKYQIYFDKLREIIHFTDDFVQEMK
ncbi:hypothetical membrane protein [Metamycoplasma cloacale]|uniref:Uncharacterized protein n=1 Tax=Metamycoplasma cloacale TaxID=92401 RepID=A0A2Z4LMB8_9BACT|nr:hypothetical protein [Metamycoplasma cloacale]AWX42628.1 hypothetical protein DK849_00820 [Metamycoplasma cloacale]VEU79606.1 hypothetical membrane protein [Metamycoplasma cloacale]